MYWKEVVASLYAWDLLDEGLEHILNILQEQARVNSTYLVALMHDEKRPLTDFYYPHNPKRKVYWTEDSRAYWRLRPEAYTHCRIKPLQSAYSSLQDKDWLQMLIQGSRARSMSVGAELSHTWVDKKRLRETYSDIVQRDIYGQPFNIHLCPNHPDVRAYGIALYVDLAQHYDIDFIQTCFIGFHAGKPDPWGGSRDSEVVRLVSLASGGCFCAHCQQQAEKQGLNWHAIVDRLRRWADAQDIYNHKARFELKQLQASSTTATAMMTEIPELYAFVKFRSDSLTAFFSDIEQAVHRIRPEIDLRYNHYARYPELMGLDLRAVGKLMNSIRSSNYAEQSGNPGEMDFKRAYLHSIRRAIGPEKYFLSAISPRPKATPTLVKQGIRISAEAGADALTIGHYDGAWPENIRAIGEGLDEAGIIIDRYAPIFS
ncbi:MAG: hypothetical protein P1S60_15460 [Anaerolineae bacterium]|nr:hypothetical protein [Anaerolineae bacterium]